MGVVAHRGHRSASLFTLLASFKTGECDGVRVALARCQQAVPTACVETLPFALPPPDAEVRAVAEPTTAMIDTHQSSGLHGARRHRRCAVQPCCVRARCRPRPGPASLSVTSSVAVRS
jgi:hypothetical protein